MLRPLALGVLLFSGCYTERSYTPPERWKLAYRMSVVPDMMLTSQHRAGPDAVVERKGYLSWEVVSSRGTAECQVLSGQVYRCVPDLEVELPPPPVPPKFVGPLSPPPLPNATGPVRTPLRPRG